ncbi:MAG: ATPase, T2SS/T4P/T4SS family [Candidatus Brocadiaceae bacterium]
MATTREHHLSFWRRLARQIAPKEGRTLHNALTTIASEMPDEPPGSVAEELARRIESGLSLSEAMSRRPDFFAPATVALVHAGEAGGVLDVVAQRTVEGIEDGSLPLPGTAEDKVDMAGYWRLMARMLSSGVPVGETLDAARSAAENDDLARATAQIREAVLSGRSFSDALGDFPDVFPREVQGAVARGERRGLLHEAVQRVAEAIEERDLGSLVTVAPSAPVGGKSPARRFVNAMILTAIKRGASDVHLEPLGEEKGRYRLRIDGVLHPYQPAPEADGADEAPYPAVVNRIKIMAGVDIAERRLPQDGRIQIEVGGKRYDIRVSTLPTVNGERVTMHVLRHEAVTLELEQLGLLEDDLERIRHLLHLPHGLILCCGPTGSGKTTLFYSMFNDVNLDHVSAISIEDPVEFEIDGLAQVQVHPQIGRTFARAIRASLRQDPDIMLIGEIRDEEVANLAAICALTGHLVMSSLHAETAADGVKRLLDIGVPPFVVNASLGGSTAQRLVRLLCPECKEPAEPSPHTLPSEAAEWLEGIESPTFYEPGPAGCEACNGTGYRGRTIINEVLVVDEEVRSAIAESGEAEDIHRAARKGGMRTILECGIEKAARGVTSVEEVLRVAPRR